MADLPSPPFVSVSGAANFRDIGGYAVMHPTSTQSIRTNFIYRSAELSNVTQDGIAKLQSLGITYVYDLRSKNEIEQNRDAGWGGIKEWDPAERIFVPVFVDKDSSPEGLPMRYKDYASEGTEAIQPRRNVVKISGADMVISQGFTRAYKDMLDSAPAAYRKILLHVAHQPSKPLLIHCTAGKDRTGVICALLLSFCGVPDSVVAHEYSLTEKGLAEFKEQIIAHQLMQPGFKDNKSGVLNMISARERNMLATLQMIREKFGGPEQYVIEKCGLTPGEVTMIRSNLVTDAPPIHDIPTKETGSEPEDVRSI